MNITNTIKLKIKRNQALHYRNFGYVLNFGLLHTCEIDVAIQHLTYSSHALIEMQCDKCTQVNILRFSTIKDKISFSYICRKCVIRKNTNSRFKNKELQKELSLRNKDLRIIKSKKTRKENYNDENFNNQEKRRLTIIERYNKEEICFGKNGHHDFYKLWYSSSNEKLFLDYLQYKHIIKVLRGPTITYNLNKKYYPDFYLEDLNLIVEIKSTYTYNLDLEKNIIKMKSCINQGYNFMFIIDNDFTKIEKLI